ncbi:Tautomerase/MIF [Xylariaceae sp. FL0594]|nr:Tautomerase/MIF [Xylariaceae sp. FL0594]
MLENPLRRSNTPVPRPTQPKSNGRASPALRTPRKGPLLVPIGPSFAQRKTRSPQPSDSVLVEGNDVMRNIDRPLPGDVVGRRKPQLDPEVSRKRSAYFESEFAASNRSDDAATARIRNEAMVAAELKTNVVIHDEFGFITDLAYQLSNRYQRPVSSITITLHHGVCMLFGGSFEPACTLTIHALPSLLQPATNRRNATVIQQHLLESLGVPFARGYVRFEPTPEENVAIGGKTVAAEVDETTRNSGDRKPGVFRKSSKSGRGIMNSMKSLGNFKASSTVDLPGKVPTPPPSSPEDAAQIATIAEIPPTPPDDRSSTKMEDQQPQRGGLRRKSFRFGLFGGSSSRA